MDKLLFLAKEVKQIVNDKAKYTDWNKRSHIQADLKLNLIISISIPRHIQLH
jgi:type I restriction enzyme R subunit